MKKGFRISSVALSGTLLLLLMIDSKTTTAGAVAGITQCVQIIIPSLFPFFFVSCWFNGQLVGSHIPFLHLAGKLLSLPKGSESILLMGVLGGYPVGAKTIRDAYESRTITKQTAHILLGYCNNAGPAFIFGISHILFPSVWIPWLIWGIQILSAVITGLLLPKPKENESTCATDEHITITDALQKSITITAIVCGWVLLFRILLYYFWRIPFIQPALPYLAGFLELSNGSIMLTEILPMSLQFTLFTVFLTAGGFCVYLQTSSTVASIGTGLYLPGKCIQTAVTTLLSLPISILLFNELPLPLPIFMPLICCCFATIVLLSGKYGKICGNYKCNRV